MRTQSISTVAINVFCLLFAPAALGCSLVGDYVRPSNFELVQLADVIVVAAAQGVGAAVAVSRFESRES